jgi:hypothetical protein
MSFAPPPAADDHKAYIPIDFREEETWIIAEVSKRLAAEDVLTIPDTGEELFVMHRGRQHKIPLTFTHHDRSIALSSLAELLKDRYRFFVRLDSFASDTLHFLVVPLAQAQSWTSLPDHLAELEVGYDYFSEIKVPYLNHEDSAPNFVAESEIKDANWKLWLGREFGNVKPYETTRLAKIVIKYPELRKQADVPADASEDEVAALLRKQLGWKSD